MNDVPGSDPSWTKLCLCRRMDVSRYTSVTATLSGGLFSGRMKGLSSPRKRLLKYCCSG